MVAFYKHDIPAWRGGTASLSHEEYRVYHVIVEEIMVQECPILPHFKMLSGIANMSVRAFKSALDRLVLAGKLQIGEDGKVANYRAEQELEFVRLNRVHAKLGGKNSSKTPRTLLEHSSNTPRTLSEPSGKRNDINGASEAPLCRPLKRPTKPIREEKRREGKEEDLQERKNLWDAGVGLDAAGEGGREAADDAPFRMGIGLRVVS